MSMNRNDTLTQLAHGIRKFDGMIAGELLATGWAGLRGLAAKDVDYFEKHEGLPVVDVARSCLGRSLARADDPLEGERKWK